MEVWDMNDFFNTQTIIKKERREVVGGHQIDGKFKNFLYKILHTWDNTCSHITSRDTCFNYVEDL